MLFSKKVFLAISLVFIVAVASIFIFARSGEPNFDSVAVIREDITELIEVTGRVEPVSRVDLAFEQSGKLESINFKVGENVELGEIIMELSNSELSARLLQAEATLRAEQSRLSELSSGTRPEEINLQQAKVSSAKTSVMDAKEDLLEEIKTGFTKSDDAIRNKADQFFLAPQSGAPQIIIATFGSHTLESDRASLNILFNVWSQSISDLSVSDDLSAKASETKKNMIQVRDFLDDLSVQVNRSGTDSEKNSLFSARSNVNAALSSLLTAEESLNSALASLNVEQESLTLSLAGSRTDQVEAQEARVDQARAQVEESRALLEKTRIRAPFDGVITRIDTEVGEIVSVNQIVTGVISGELFEIDVDIPEVDISKVHIGDRADITLDAYGDEVPFEAEVTVIEPAETIIDGVPTYGARLRFLEADERIRSGMTANVEIVTDRVSNALSIPSRAIVRKDGKSYVRLVNGDSYEEVLVETGIRGFDGGIEIISGLSEGDMVVTFLRDE